MCQSRCDRLSCIPVCCCIKQGNLHECLCKYLRLLDMEFIHKHKFQNLAMTALINMKEHFLANILLMYRHQVKFKQTYLPETVSYEDMSFSDWRSTMKVTLALLAKRAFSVVSEGVNSKKFSIAPLASSKPTAFSICMQNCKCYRLRV